MGATTDHMIEQMEKEQDSETCSSCGEDLTIEEKETERGMCFDCYCDSQDR